MQDLLWGLKTYNRFTSIIRANTIKCLVTAAMIAALMLSAVSVMAEDQSIPLPATSQNNATELLSPPDCPSPGSPSGLLSLALENHTYYPNDTVRVYVFNATVPEAYLIDPDGRSYNVTVSSINNSTFIGEYVLSTSVILDNYTVRATDTATGAYVEDAFEVTMPPAAAAPSPTATPAPESPPFYLRMSLPKSDFVPPGQVDITVTTNAGTPTVVVQDPMNNTMRPAVACTGNGTYSCAYHLKNAVILGNYTVMAYVNGTDFSTVAYFNVTGPVTADNDVSIEYAAYDPVQKAVVVRAEVDPSTLKTSDIRERPAFKGAKVESVKVLPDIDSGFTPGSPAARDKPKMKKVEVVLPVSDTNKGELSRRYNLSEQVFGTTMSVTGVPEATSGNLTPGAMHVELKDKVDGAWYRMAVDIPAAYKVEKVTRSDGVELLNYREVSGDGTVKDTLSWYVDNGTLYFYDDPINGYDVSLVPPVSRMSLSVELVNPGMLSAAVYPFNSTDSADTIKSHDHMGRIDDNYASNDMGDRAGSKSAVGIDGNTYGNENVNKDGAYIFLNRTNYYFNIAPDGKAESIVISNFSVSFGAGGLINITQKTILRGNDRWFSTIYYFRNSGNVNVSNFNFYQYGDFNFDNQDVQNSEYYDHTNDSVFGYYSAASAGQIQYGGFTSPIHSNFFEVKTDQAVAKDISNGKNLTQTDYCSSNGAMALQWYKGSLVRGESWTLPVVWFFGYNIADMQEQAKNAKSSVFDLGVKEFVYPNDGQNIDPYNMPMVNINVTAMDVNLTDAGQATSSGLTANLSLYIDGPYGYNKSFYNNQLFMMVPVKETDNALFSWNISSVPTGTYTLRAYTNLTNSTGADVDGYAPNNFMQISVNIRNFALYPNQTKTVQFGDNAPYQLTAANIGGGGRNFSLALSGSQAGWATDLYDGDYSHPMAFDTDGDGTWDTVNAGYNDSGKPCIYIGSNSSKTLLLIKEVPVTAEPGTVDNTILTMSPAGFPEQTSSALLNTHTPLPPTVNKTFYLHPTAMNTSADLNSSSSTVLVSNMYTFWSQRPDFASNFTVVGNSTASLWINATTGNKQVTASLFYTNGLLSGPVGSTTIALDSATLKNYNVTIPCDTGISNVPPGWHLVLKIDNMNTNNMTIYHDSTHQSYVRVNTTTYVHTDTIITTNGTVNTTYFLPNETIHVAARITDPIGSYDITRARYVLYAPNDSMLIENASMTLAGTDPSTPSFWRNYTVDIPILSNYPLGRYNVSVAGYESNGVIHQRNWSIYLISGTSDFSLYPITLNRYGTNGTTIYLKHTITNLNMMQADTIDITYTKSLNWTTALLESDSVTPLSDHDGNGIPDTGPIGPLGHKDILVQLVIPNIAGVGDINMINITGRSYNDDSTTHTANDQVVVVPPILGKTLYLYPTAPLALNTSVYSGSSSTAVSPGSDYAWTQTPGFAKDFYIMGNPNLTLYASSSVASDNMTIRLYSSNGTVSTLLTSTNYTLSGLTASPQAFTIPLSLGDSATNTTIPASSYLQVNMTNLDPASLTIYQSSTCPSRLDMNTTSYIGVVQATGYNNSSILTNVTPPWTIRVTANLTDPFGLYDIKQVNASVYSGDSALAVGPLSMNASTVYPIQNIKQYELNISLSDALDTGDYIIVVTGTETNGVTQNKSIPFTIKYPPDVTVYKSFTGVPGTDNYLVTINLTNNDVHTINGVYVYDFNSSYFTVSNFNQVRLSAPVDNGILSGIINIYGPFSLHGTQSVITTHDARGSGNYDASEMLIVGVDPPC